MQITSRFTIAVHIITCLEHFKDQDRVNSEFLAGSVGVNPVIVRTVISMLREAGIVRTRRGSSGAVIARPLDQITFYDIFQAVDSVDEEEGLFHFHEQPNPHCPVGKNIHMATDGRLKDVEAAMENEMRRITMADVVRDTERAISEGA